VENTFFTKIGKKRNKQNTSRVALKRGSSRQVPRSPPLKHTTVQVPWYCCVTWYKTRTALFLLYSHLKRSFCVVIILHVMKGLDT